MTRTETLRRLTAKEAEKLLAGRDYPIEQSAAWARYEKALATRCGDATSMKTASSQ